MTDLNRRAFLQHCTLAALGACAALSGLPGVALAAGKGKKHPVGLREAMYYDKLAGGEVQCNLCPCDPQIKGRLKDGQYCVCSVRVNQGGTLYVTNYARAATLHKDNLEKNPLYHFHPGTHALTLSAPGCALACKCCQNWKLSQSRTEDVETVDAPPEKVVKLAVQEGCKAISYTYTEPMMYYEYLLDIARGAREQGLYNTVVSGGFVYPEPVKALAKVVDAFSISVKAFSDQEYMTFARGKLSTIKACMMAVKESGSWLEVVILVIPTVSDDLTKMKGFIRWVKANLGADTPIHIDRFMPAYKLTNLPETPEKSLEDARALALSEGMHYAYIGNLPGHWAANTNCPKCKAVAVKRVAFTVLENNIDHGKCGNCGYQIPGVW